MDMKLRTAFMSGLLSERINSLIDVLENSEKYSIEEIRDALSKTIDILKAIVGYIEINTVKSEQIDKIPMTRFNMFMDEELDTMEEAFCGCPNEFEDLYRYFMKKNFGIDVSNERLECLIDEVRRERRYREEYDSNRGYSKSQ